MDPFSYRDGELFAEELPVTQLAERFGRIGSKPISAHWLLVE